MRPRRSSGLGERLTWCQDARPQPTVVHGRKIAAGVQKAVLWALVNRADADGSCYPSQRLLVEETCLSRATVHGAIWALKEQGYLEVVPAKPDRRSPSYVLDLTHSEARRESSGDSPGGSTVSAGDSAASPGGMGLSQPEAGVASPGGTIEEPPKEPPSRTTQEPTSASPTPLERVGIIADPAKRPRPPDPLWDAVVDWYGSDPSEAERGHWNRAMAAFRSAGVVPSEIAPLFDEALRQWERPFKPMAVASNLVALRMKVREPERTGSDPVLAELRRRRAEREAG